MGVDIDIFDLSETETAPNTKTYKINWESGRITGKADGIESLKQHIKKVLLTPRFQCLIYNDQFGADIKDMLAQRDNTPELVEAELSRMIEDALQDERIFSITDYRFDFTGDFSEIQFTVHSIYGNIQVKEAI